MAHVDPRREPLEAALDLAREALPALLDEIDRMERERRSIEDEALEMAAAELESFGDAVRVSPPPDPRSHDMAIAKAFTEYGTGIIGRCARIVRSLKHAKEDGR
jgi:hypothetical protein